MIFVSRESRIIHYTATWYMLNEWRIIIRTTHSVIDLRYLSFCFIWLCCLSAISLTAKQEVAILFMKKTLKKKNGCVWVFCLLKCNSNNWPKNNIIVIDPLLKKFSIYPSVNSTCLTRTWRMSNYITFNRDNSPRRLDNRHMTWHAISWTFMTG